MFKKKFTIVVISIFFIVTNTDAMIKNTVILKKNDKSAQKKRHYRSHYYRNIPSRRYKLHQEIHGHGHDRNHKRGKVIKDSNTQKKKNNHIEQGYQQAVYDIVRKTQKNENAKRQYDKQQQKQENDNDVAKKQRMWPYLMTFAAGIYSINFVIEECYNTDFIHEGHEFLIDNLRTNADLNFDENFKKMTNMSFVEFKEFFENETDMSIEDLIRWIIQEKNNKGKSIDEIVFHFLDQLKIKKNKEHFIKIGSVFFNPLVEKEAPKWCKSLGLVDPLAKDYTNSFYKYLTSPKNEETIKQICNLVNEDIESFKDVAKVSTYLAGAIVLDLISEDIFLFTLENGAMRTICLLPASVIPIALGFALHKHAPEKLTYIGNRMLSVVASGAVQQFYTNFNLCLDPGQNTDPDEAPFAVIVNSFKDQLQETKNRLDNKYFSLLDKIKTDVQKEKSSARRFVSSVCDKIIGN